MVKKPLPETLGKGRHPRHRRHRRPARPGLSHRHRPPVDPVEAGGMAGVQRDSSGAWFLTAAAPPFPTGNPPSRQAVGNAASPRVCTSCAEAKNPSRSARMQYQGKLRFPGPGDYSEMQHFRPAATHGRDRGLTAPCCIPATSIRIKSCQHLSSLFTYCHDSPEHVAESP